MRKEILPEMFNYNKYPGPDFVYVADLLKSDACQFTVLENHKEIHHSHLIGMHHRMALLHSALVEVVAMRIDHMHMAPPTFGYPILDAHLH